MLLCVSLVWPIKFANTLSFVQNWFNAWKFMENVRNFNFGKIGLNSLFLKIISSYTNAFCSSISMLWDVSKFFFQKLCFSFKFVWASVCFDWSNLFFDQSKLFWNCFKIFNESLSVSINRNSWIRFLKNQIWLIQKNFFKTFQNFFLSLRLDKAPQRFFVVFLQISCKVFLSLSRYVYITLPFALIFTFSCIISWFLGNFQTMHNLGFLINQALFYEFDQWVLLLQCCIHDLYWLI